MSILIKGMKMPELYETYKVNFAMTNDGKIVMGMCPLNETGYRPVGEVVALPDKHGRLVDADEIVNAMNEMKVEGEVFVTAVNYVKLIMNDADTIVEAEDRE